MITYLILFLLSLAFLLYSSRRRPARPRQITLVGPPGSGKTALFSRINYGQFLATHTSTRTNLALLDGGGEVVDIPGNEGIRLRSLIEHIHHTTNLVFLLPSLGVPTSINHLLLILSIIPLLPFSQRPNLIILISKSDTLPPSSVKDNGKVLIERIRNSTEREIQKINSAGRKNKSSLEGLEKISAVPSTLPSAFPTSLTSLQPLLASTYDTLHTLLSPSASTSTNSRKSIIPTDELEILNPTEESLSIFSDGVSWSWKVYAEEFGVQVDWVVGNSKEADGLVDFWSVVRA